MAWNPSPKIADLRDIARKWNVQQVIVLAVNQKTGTYEVNSFGETRALCDQAKTINEQIFKMVANGVIEIDA
jgi:hypothetical protein